MDLKALHKVDLKGIIQGIKKSSCTVRLTIILDHIARREHRYVMILQITGLCSMPTFLEPSLSTISVNYGLLEVRQRMWLC